MLCARAGIPTSPVHLFTREAATAAPRNLLLSMHYSALSSFLPRRGTSDAHFVTGACCDCIERGSGSCGFTHAHSSCFERDRTPPCCPPGALSGSLNIGRRRSAIDQRRLDCAFTSQKSKCAPSWILRGGPFALVITPNRALLLLQHVVFG